MNSYRLILRHLCRINKNIGALGVKQYGGPRHAKRNSFKVQRFYGEMERNAG